MQPLQVDLKRPIDVLINNAGIMPSEPSITVDGCDLAFQCNHLGHFLLTTLVTPLLKKSKSVQSLRRPYQIGFLLLGAGLPFISLGAGLPFISLGAGLPFISLGAGLSFISLAAGLPFLRRSESYVLGTV
jgi:NAD(P)-dependent dehydrogenase (short-subunit alcohol dehydrogenase family)